MKRMFKIIDIDYAIKRLQDLKKKNKDRRVVIYTIDFDSGEEERIIATPDEGCGLVKKSKTIILNEDEFIPHMELYSIVQNDLENIIKEGIMHDIILPG